MTREVWHEAATHRRRIATHEYPRRVTCADLPTPIPPSACSNEYNQPVGYPVPQWAARTRPDGRVLAGRSVRLEPLSAAHADDLFAATCGPGRERHWTYLPVGPFATPEDHAAHLVNLATDQDLVPYAIVEAASGRARGTASYLRIATAAGSIEVGWVNLGAGLARTRGATEAMWLMARHVFDELGYRRYEWKCDALNAPSRAAAERLGFRYEGTFRQALVYKGRNRDTAWFAMTDSDWARVSGVYQRWLSAPTPQVHRLSELTRQALADSAAPAGPVQDR